MPESSEERQLKLLAGFNLSICELWIKHSVFSSTCEKSTKGAPQGCVLGPSVFIFHINRGRQNVAMRLYADDSVVYFHVSI